MEDFGVKRRQLCEYLTAMIQNCSVAEGDAERTCNKAVQAALNFHRQAMADNCGVCLMGKYHNILYIAARLAFLFQLRNSKTIRELLEAMFHCEGTFERIISGALFGPRLSGTISGWKSEFDSREECTEALRYFLRHAARSQAVFPGPEGRMLRMADVPLVVASRQVPATLAVYTRRADVFRLLVEFGAELGPAAPGETCPLDALRELRKDECRGERGDEIVRLAECLYPPSGDGRPLPSLKLLARRALREDLNLHFMLPDFVPNLPLPKSLVAYVQLEVPS